MPENRRNGDPAPEQEKKQESPFGEALFFIARRSPAYGLFMQANADKMHNYYIGVYFQLYNFRLTQHAFSVMMKACWGSITVFSKM